MTISIQGSTSAVLAVLDQLGNQGGVSAGSPAGVAAPSAEADASSSSSAIIDLSGFSPGALGGAAGSQVSNASIADAAVASGTIIESLLAQMRDAAASAADPSVDSDTRAALNAGFQSGLSQIQAAVSAAGVDGVNLINGSANPQTSGGLAAYDLTPGGPELGIPAGAGLSDPAAAASLADQLQTALGNVGSAVSTLTDQSDAIQNDLAGASQTGSAGFDPTLDADGARLAALQIQQQLSGNSASIGNQSPAAILALFR